MAQGLQLKLQAQQAKKQVHCRQTKRVTYFINLKIFASKVSSVLVKYAADSIVEQIILFESKDEDNYRQTLYITSDSDSKERRRLLFREFERIPNVTKKL